MEHVTDEFRTNLRAEIWDEDDSAPVQPSFMSSVRRRSPKGFLFRVLVRLRRFFENF